MTVEQLNSLEIFFKAIGYGALAFTGLWKAVQPALDWGVKTYKTLKKKK